MDFGVKLMSRIPQNALDKLNSLILPYFKEQENLVSWSLHTP